MIATDLITDDIPPVKASDSVQQALDWMGSFGTSQLPVVDRSVFQGIASENMLLDAANPEADVSTALYAGWENAFVTENAHLYDVLRMMNAFDLEVLPVLDSKRRYEGLITARNVVQRLGDFFGIQEPGGVLVLEVDPKDYVLSEVGRITEGEDAKVLSLNLAPNAQGKIEITLKLNVEDLSRVVASFERFKYVVVSIHQKLQSRDDLRGNFDMLMGMIDD